VISRIDDHRARRHPLGFDEMWRAGSGDHDVGVANPML